MCFFLEKRSLLQLQVLARLWLPALVGLGFFVFLILVGLVSVVRTCFFLDLVRTCFKKPLYNTTSAPPVRPYKQYLSSSGTLVTT